MRSLHVGEELASYTGVIIHTGLNANGKEITYSAGSSSGYVLEVTNPIGTQQMAYSILAGLKLRGSKYQPFSAEGALLDPAAEIGDRVSVNGTSSLIMNRSLTYSPFMAADISQPFDEEIDHEFQYEPKSVREFKRESAYTRARLSVNQDEIRAEVARATSAEGTLSASISIQADRITSEVARATGVESEMSSRITQTSDAITAEVTRATAAEGNLSTRITQNADSITSEVAARTNAVNAVAGDLSAEVLRATGAEATLSSTITQTAASITSTVAGAVSKYDTSSVSVDLYGYTTPATAGYAAAEYNNKIYLNQANGKYYKSNGTSWVQQGTLSLITDNLKTSIDQRLDSITLSVSSSSGSSTFAIKDGSTTLDTKTLDLSVKSVNISGKLTIGQLDADAQSKIVVQAQTRTQYYLSTSSSSATGGSWSNSMPTWTSGKYLWTRERTYNKYADNSSEYIYSPDEDGRYDKNLTDALSTAAAAGTAASGAQTTADSANKRTSMIYISTAGGTAPTAPSAWVTSLTASLNTWTQVRPEYDSSYPVLYVARQTETVGGTYSCTTPKLDNTTTVIDGAHIITGTIDASKIAVADLSALNAKIGNWTIGSTYLGNETTTNRVRLNATSAMSSTSNAISVATRASASDSWTTQFSVTYGGKVTCKNADIEGKITATSGTIGGVTISNGTLTGITGTNIATGGIYNGNIADGTIQGGKIGSSTISTSNTDYGINSGVYGGTAYNDAVNGNQGASSFYVTSLYVMSNVMRGMYSGSQRALTLQTITTSNGQYLVYAQKLS